MYLNCIIRAVTQYVVRFSTKDLLRGYATFRIIGINTKPSDSIVPFDTKHTIATTHISRRSASLFSVSCSI